MVRIEDDPDVFLIRSSIQSLLRSEKNRLKEPVQQLQMPEGENLRWDPVDSGSWLQSGVEQEKLSTMSTIERDYQATMVQRSPHVVIHEVLIVGQE